MKIFYSSLLFLVAIFTFVFFNQKEEISTIQDVSKNTESEVEIQESKKIYPQTPQIIDGVIIGGQKILVEVAVMLDEITKGLSGRESLREGNGMLFVFEDMGDAFSPAHDFWMRNMKFSIDMIWIGRDHKIVYIKKDARPESYPETFGPGAEVDARYVLEVNSGFSEKYNIKEGDLVEFFGHDFPKQ